MEGFIYLRLIGWLILVISGDETKQKLKAMRTLWSMLGSEPFLLILGTVIELLSATHLFSTKGIDFHDGTLFLFLAKFSFFFSYL